MKQAKDDVKTPDQDISDRENEVMDVLDRWDKVKKELDVNLTKVETLIPNAEKGWFPARVFILQSVILQIPYYNCNYMLLLFSMLESS